MGSPPRVPVRTDSVGVCLPNTYGVQETNRGPGGPIGAAPLGKGTVQQGSPFREPRMGGCGMSLLRALQGKPGHASRVEGLENQVLQAV